VLGPLVVQEDAINQALERIGVKPWWEPFEALELGRHRSTEGWVDHRQFP
jgi:hypothetical protein